MAGEFHRDRWRALMRPEEKSRFLYFREKARRLTLEFCRRTGNLHISPYDKNSEAQEQQNAPPLIILCRLQDTS